MIGAKLDGETQRKKLISTRHPKQAATQSFFALAKARRRKSSSERRRAPSLRWLKQKGGKAQANVAEGGEYP